MSFATEMLTRRRRHGLLILSFGLSLHLAHGWAMSSVEGNPLAERAVGTAIGTVGPLCLVVGAYLVLVTPAAQAAGKKRRRGVPGTSDR